jgi:hypothetical protein
MGRRIAAAGSLMSGKGAPVLTVGRYRGAVVASVVGQS